MSRAALSVCSQVVVMPRKSTRSTKAAISSPCSGSSSLGTQRQVACRMGSVTARSVMRT